MFTLCLLYDYIPGSIRIEAAALSDNNIPFLHDGNTQQIQKFDKIYINFEEGQHNHTTGDYEITLPKNYLLNFNKKGQGLILSGGFFENKIGMRGSMAKAEFCTEYF